MPPQTSRIGRALRRAARSPTVVILVALLVGALIAPTAYSAATDYGESTSKIAVIEVPRLIAPQTTGPVQDALQDARHNESIEAVVLRVNTPGGALSATESLALEIERTTEVMPVVTSVSQMAASGGYYVSAPTDEIVASPSALVGSVGINFAYVDSPVTRSAIRSGPDKAGGFTEEEAIEMADIMVEGFYGTVLEHRGNQLQLTPEELAYAKVYPSQVALQNGLIDRVGTLDTALQRAAERAGLDRYEVVRPDTSLDLGLLGFAANVAGGDRSGHVRALLDPVPGVKSPVALALYGTLPQEQVIVSTAGAPPQDRLVTDGGEHE